MCKGIKDQVAKMSKDIMSNSIEIDKNLESDVLDILKTSDLKSSPHMELFWQQQNKLLASPKFGRRYHHQILLVITLKVSVSLQRIDNMWCPSIAK